MQAPWCCYWRSGVIAHSAKGLVACDGILVPPSTSITFFPHTISVGCCFWLPGAGSGEQVLWTSPAARSRALRPGRKHRSTGRTGVVFSPRMVRGWWAERRDVPAPNTVHHATNPQPAAF